MPQIRSVAVSLLIATQALDAQVYLHPIISSGERSFRSIALAPPTADMIAQGFRRSDFKEKEAEQLAAALAGVSVERYEEERLGSRCQLPCRPGSPG